MMKIKIAKGFMRIYLTLGRGIAAYTPWGTIYFINEKAMKNKKVRAHELEHARQIEKEGIVKFGLKYLYYLIKKGYWNNPYEVSARKKMGIKNKKEHLKFRQEIMKIKR